ncbi:hypothetical protein [Thalassotalea euphylliae]
MTASTLSRILTGQSAITFKMSLRISQTLERSPASWLGAV